MSSKVPGIVTNNPCDDTDNGGTTVYDSGGMGSGGINQTSRTVKAHEQCAMKPGFVYVTVLPMYAQVTAVGETFTLFKEPTNEYDDEAIKVMREGIFDNDEFDRVGYLANSVKTVIRGTRSAGRVYDYIENGDKVQIIFFNQNFGIGEIQVQ